MNPGEPGCGQRGPSASECLNLKSLIFKERVFLSLWKWSLAPEFRADDIFVFCSGASASAQGVVSWRPLPPERPVHNPPRSRFTVTGELARPKVRVGLFLAPRILKGAAVVLVVVPSSSSFRRCCGPPLLSPSLPRSQPAPLLESPPVIPKLTPRSLRPEAASGCNARGPV